MAKKPAKKAAPKAAKTNGKKGCASKSKCK